MHSVFRNLLSFELLIVYSHTETLLWIECCIVLVTCSVSLKIGFSLSFTVQENYFLKLDEIFYLWLFCEYLFFCDELSSVNEALPEISIKRYFRGTFINCSILIMIMFHSNDYPVALDFCNCSLLCWCCIIWRWFMKVLKIHLR